MKFSYLILVIIFIAGCLIATAIGGMFFGIGLKSFITEKYKRENEEKEIEGPLALFVGTVWATIGFGSLACVLSVVLFCLWRVSVVIFK